MSVLRVASRFSILFIYLIIAGCELTASVTPTPTKTRTPKPSPTLTLTPRTFGNEVYYDLEHTDHGLLINTGGDVDTEIVSLPNSEEKAFRSGNGQVLSSSDGNTVPDSYIQFRVDDSFIFAGSPTTRVIIVVEYLDEGTGRFNIQYDALGGGPYGNGQFKDSGYVYKLGSGEIRTAEISICDANFANRDQDADFRLSDSGDGAETIRRITVRKVTETTGPAEINVDSFGANPFDDQPDSEAIQTSLNQACSGDNIVFTSPGGDPDYQGYIINQTIVLVHPNAKSDLNFSSTNPEDHALLIASADLKGFVAQLYARSIMTNAGEIDNITVNNLDFDGNRAERTCNGANEIGDGIDDNWGSWLQECSDPSDPWCSPGTLAMRGFFGEDSSYGIVVQDVTISNTECATALAFHSIEGMIDSVVIDTAGDHVHGPGCSLTDPDEPSGAWSDGITFAAFNSILSNNTIINASDIGIVCFACTNTILSNNTIIAEPGNYGMFAGIALHPWGNGDFSGIEITGNQVINQADETCGGIHAGINLGLHMWGAGCSNNPAPTAVGTAGSCSAISPPPGGALCDPNQPCRLWGYIPEGATLTLTDNFVTGAQVNYLIGGLEIAGDLIESGNISETPRMTDWQDDNNCTRYEVTESWVTIDFAAHDPILPGWTDQLIHCER